MVECWFSAIIMKMSCLLSRLTLSRTISRCLMWSCLQFCTANRKYALKDHVTHKLTHSEMRIQVLQVKVALVLMNQVSKIFPDSSKRSSIYKHNIQLYKYIFQIILIFSMNFSIFLLFFYFFVYYFISITFYVFLKIVWHFYIYISIFL